MTEIFSINPATHKLLWKGKSATPHEIKQAITRAKNAFPVFSGLSFKERVDIALRFAALLDDSFAELISQEMGKPLWESKLEVEAMKNKVLISIQAHEERCSTRVENRTTIQHKPHGVVAVFGSFNFPGHLPHGHIVPALLAGNTIIFKPSEFTTLVGKKMVMLWQQAGLPEDVLILVQGGKEVGVRLTKDADIRGIFFTGSAVAGQSIAKTSLKFPHRIVALEMGGNNPLIIRPNANIEACVYLTIQSAFLTSGQRCSCARRLIIIENDKTLHFLDHLITTTKSLMTGPYTTRPEPYMGPLINAQAAEKIIASYTKLIQSGCTPLLKMYRPDSEGCFVTPGIVDTTGFAVDDAEVFGPLLQVIRVQTLDEAIQQANHTAYGLTAGIISDDEQEYRRVQNEVRAGVINWNTPLTGASSKAPFGGLGLSGNFRPTGYYSCDYCAYPVASTEASSIVLPEKFPPGFLWK
ncbi:MAG: astD [Chlamydiia bacterium]|nr:astD [Chlamydiia bacterium]